MKVESFKEKKKKKTFREEFLLQLLLIFIWIGCFPFEHNCRVLMYCILPTFLFTFTSLEATYGSHSHYSPWLASPSSSAQTLSLGVELLKCKLYSQVGSSGPRHCCHIAPEALSKAHTGPAPLSNSLSLPPPFLSHVAAPSKCQHLFSIKRVIVSVKKKKKGLLSNQSPLNTWKETSTPPLSLIESIDRWKWEQGDMHMTNLTCTWQTSSCEARYETIVNLCHN